MLLATGIASATQPAPSFFVQYLQLAHAVLGAALLVVGALYLAVHVAHTSAGVAGTVRALRVRWLGIVLLAALALAAVLLVELGYGAKSFPWTRPLNDALTLLWVALPLRVAYLVVRLLWGRDASPLRTGELAAWVALITALTGIGVIAGAKLYGSTWTSAWFLHIVSTLLLVPLAASHVIGSRLRTAASGERRPYPWRQPVLGIALPLVLVSSVLIVSIAQTGAEARARSASAPSAAGSMEQGFADAIPAGCWYCHAEVTEDWRGSPHALAAVDPVVTALVRRLYEERGPSEAAQCLRCHAPHALDPARASSFDEVAGSEGYRAGVHCVTCHRGAPGAEHRNGAMEVAPLDWRQDGLVTDVGALGPPRHPSRSLAQAGGLPALARSLLYEASVDVLLMPRVDRHRERFRSASREAVSCAPCHVQTLAGPTHGALHDVIQDPFDSWAASRFATQGPDCRGCHAPRYLSSADYPVADHRFLAANTYLAGIAGGAEREAEVESVLTGAAPPGRAPLGGSAPAAASAAAPLLTIQVQLAPPGEGDASRVTIDVRNPGHIGHSFPNGPTDLLQVWLALRVVDAEGRTLIDDGWDGHPGSMRLGHELVGEDGAPIEDHRLWAVARVVDRGTVPVDGSLSRTVALTGVAPALPVRAVAAVLYRRFDPALVSRLTHRPAPSLPIVTMARFDGLLR